jgi:muramoyltetrapeptide carboxypeptidase LdcA involved in peptidoglycan recycling
MKKFIKPEKLNIGDTVATISLSGGSAGEKDMNWRYNLAKKRLQNEFGIRVIETQNSQKGRNFIYHNPKARADDLMEALSEPAIKAIFLNQGGDDGIRILPYIDFDVIRNNPKIFMGYSDGSTFCNMFTRAGVVSFYGPNVITTLSEPAGIHDYTLKWIRKILFSNEPAGLIEPTSAWTIESRDWTSDEKEKRRMRTDHCGYEILQGSGKVHGRLIGGCAAPLQVAKGTRAFPDISDFTGSIIFLEGIIPYDGRELSGIHLLRSLAATGMFRKANGIVVAKPADCSFEDTKRICKRVIVEEEGLRDLPIIFNIDCGHSAPMAIIPFGIDAEIDCDNCTFSITESAVK